MGAPRIIAFASHKGGTGRSTALLGLAWALGQRGHAVTVVDAAPIPCLDLIACDASGSIPWRGVELAAWPEAVDRPLVFIDLPPLLSRSAGLWLARCDAVLLTSLPESLSLRTLGRATQACTEAARRSELGVLGLLMSLYDGRSALHEAVLSELRDLDPELLLEPALPLDPALSRWPLEPGAPPPPGPGREALLALAEAFEARLLPAEPEPTRGSGPTLSDFFADPADEDEVPDAAPFAFPRDPLPAREQAPVAPAPVKAELETRHEPRPWPEAPKTSESARKRSLELETVSIAVPPQRSHARCVDCEAEISGRELAEGSATILDGGAIRCSACQAAADKPKRPGSSTTRLVISKILELLGGG